MREIIRLCAYSRPNHQEGHQPHEKRIKPESFHAGTMLRDPGPKVKRRHFPRRSRGGEALTEFTNYDLRVTIAYDFTPPARIGNQRVSRKS